MNHSSDIFSTRAKQQGQPGTIARLAAAVQQPLEPSGNHPPRSTPVSTSKPSERQLEFLRDLLGQGLISAEAQQGIEAQLAAGKVDRDRCSRYIDKLVQARKDHKAAQPGRAIRTGVATVEPEAGMYITQDGTVVRCYLGQRSGKMLVKRVVGDKASGYSYEYVGAALHGKGQGLMEGAKRMQLEEAKAWGRMTGHCCVCARQLDDPESVDAGIGPVCAKRVG